MNGDGHFFHFWLELPFSGKLGPKNQNCKSKWWNLIFRLIRISRIQHGVHFICFRLEIPFLDKLGPENQNRNFKLKCDIQTNSSMQNSTMVFILFVWDWKYPFWKKLVQKFKIVSLSWNLEPLLIRICRMQWRCSLFLF